MRSPLRSMIVFCLIGIVPTIHYQSARAQERAPAGDRLKSRFVGDVDPAHPHPEYPRPQLVRDRWVNLNGLWEYAITDEAVRTPSGYEGRILVPFPIESSLSGVMKTVGPGKLLHYRRTFSVPAEWRGEGRRVLLHFGAVDWQTMVEVNGRKAAEHKGGYAPFTADVTDHLEGDGPQTVTVAVIDPTDTSFQPRGKQVNKPQSIWYTPTTGIWQTVWLESVPGTSIDRLTMTPDLDHGTLHLTAHPRGPAVGYSVRATALDGETPVGSVTAGFNQTASLRIPDVKLWSPDSPFLYNLTVEMLRDGRAVDSVRSYFGMRKVSLANDSSGTPRIHINDKPLFQFGPLDQGFWPDGLYTAPTDEALRYDLEVTKRLGFNMVRKHMKVEPARWYYHADRLGLLVWQDMPSGDENATWDPHNTHDNTEMTRSAASMANYYHEWGEIMAALHNHPSIIMWVPFNEAWGQSRTVEVTNWTMNRDPSRVVNAASGGNDFPVGHVLDLHRYPGPAAPLPDPRRALVLGEYGGLGLPLPDHTWQDKANWGYRNLTTTAELNDRYADMLRSVRLYTAYPGISAAIYTQTTDVEIEVNGFMTYDRQVLKLDADRIAPLTRALYQPLPTVTTLLPPSIHHPIEWRFTTEKPAEGWNQSGFDDSNWNTAPAPFGTKGTPGARYNTVWNTPEIFVRNTFTVAEKPAGKPYLYTIHDEDATIYLNGKQVAQLPGYIPDYHFVSIDPAAIRTGVNTIAIHCKQTEGGQSLDAGVLFSHDPAWD